MDRLLSANQGLLSFLLLMEELQQQIRREQECTFLSWRYSLGFSREKSLVLTYIVSFVYCQTRMDGAFFAPSQASRDEQLLRKHLQAMYQDEQSLNHQGFGSHLCSTYSLRPKSVAVPGMTTSSTFCPSAMLHFLQEPQVRIKTSF